MATLKWVSHSKGDDLPANVIEAGNRSNGTVLLVARGMKESEMTPGKYSVERDICRVPWGGQEWVLDEYELLTCDKQDLISWVSASGGEVPVGGVVGGWKEGTETYYYIGRADQSSELIPGKIAPEYQTAYVSTQNKEWAKNEYEAMVVKYTLPPGPSS